MPIDVSPLSFRDPMAQVVAVGGLIHRAVHLGHADAVEALLDQPWLQARMARGDMPATHRCERPAGAESWGDGWRWLRHDTLEFALHAHEITSQQLHDAALLTLDLAGEALAAGYLLKDASAWNVLHAEGRAVFVDLTSFVPHDGQSLWLAYGQFGRHFIIPLLLARHLHLTPADVFVRHRDGMTPEMARRLLGRRRSFSSLAAMEFVGLPAMLRGAKPAAPPSGPAAASGVERAVQAQRALLARLRGIVRSLEPARRERSTTWSGYTAQRDHYTEPGLALKHEFLTRRLVAGQGRLLDLGCNTGEYALHAARAGRPVVAADIDEQSLHALHAGRAGLPVSTWLLDLANPGPALGWRNAEVAPTLQRARGRFGTVLCVGLLHHLLVTVRAPLANVMAFLAELAPEELLIEWVPPQDRKFKEIAGPNLPLYEHLDAAAFETALAPDWTVEERLPVPGNDRVLYALRRRALRESMGA
jgi:SAM-dependent methyltransferase